MGIKRVVLRQYQRTVNEAAESFREAPSVPPEGWITSTRKALGMPATQLARRLKVSRPRVSELERAERTGGVTLKSMERAAKALGCKFVYAIVPDGRIEDVIEEQARSQAAAIVHRASVHMALEGQALDPDTLDERIDDLAREMMAEQGREFWDDDRPG